MAISFVGSLPTVGANNGGNVTLTFSNLVTAAGGAATLQEGDLVVCAYASSGIADAAMSTSSSLWNEVHESYSNGSANDTNLALYWKVMGASPDTSFVAVGPTGNNNGTIGVAFAFRDVDTATPLDIAFVAGSHAATGTASTRPNAPAITPVSAGAWILVAGAGAAAVGAAFTNPGDLSATTNHFRSGNHAETIDIAIGIGIKTDWASGPFDPAAWTGGAANAGDSWAVMIIALKPAPPPEQTLTPSLFTNSQTFHAPTVAPGSVTLTPSLATNTQTFFAPAVTPVQSVAVDLFTNSQAFFAPTVAPGAVTLTPALFTNGQTFFSPTAAPGPVTLAPSLFSNSQSFHSPTVAAGSVSLTPSLFTNSATFFGPTVSEGGGGEQELEPSLATNTQTFPSAAASASNDLAPALATNTQAFFAATIAPGPITLQPALVANDNGFFGPSITSRVPLPVPAARTTVALRPTREAFAAGRDGMTSEPRASRTTFAPRRTG